MKTVYAASVLTHRERILNFVMSIAALLCRHW